MASSSLLSSCNDGTLESTGPASGEEQTGHEEEEGSGGALFITGLWNIEHVCKVSTLVDDGPTVVNTWDMTDNTLYACYIKNVQPSKL